MRKRRPIPAVPPSSVESGRVLFDNALKASAEQLESFIETADMQFAALSRPCNFGVFISDVDQTQTAIDTAKEVTFTETQLAENVTLDGSPQSRITIRAAGVYNFQFSIQIASSNSNAQYVWIWPRLNGLDVPNSATEISISSNSAKIVPAWNFVFPMRVGDYFELMWATSSTNVTLEHFAPTAFCPAVPSVILTVNQAGRLAV